jgi:1-pyrroline-5-carboxylate dehydrogenase
MHRQRRSSSPLVSRLSDSKVKTGQLAEQRNPASHRTVVARYHSATPEIVDSAIKSALKAKQEWENMPWNDRAAIFLKAADLLSGKWRYKVMAATMLGQGKNAWQAEIDAAAELIDFLRFNVKYANDLYAIQPPMNAKGVWNRTEYRPLEGFVFAITPFNFTAIGGNLAAAPALLGNVVLWKPSPSAVLSNYFIYKVLEEAGLPKGVIQFIPAAQDQVEGICDSIFAHRDFAGLHYTGSTAVFKKLWKDIANNIDVHRSYPRVVGETGGKDFHVYHPSADVKNGVINAVRGAFEYQGQKCSALSRAYVARSLWEKRGFKKLLLEEVKKIKVGNPVEWGNFVGPLMFAPSQRVKLIVVTKGRLTRRPSTLRSPREMDTRLLPAGKVSLVVDFAHHSR